MTQRTFDVLHSSEWRLITDWATAVERSDYARIVKVVRKVDEAKHRPRVFRLLLELALARTVELSVNEFDRRNVISCAEGLYSEWSEIIRFDYSVLERALLTACEFADGPAEMLESKRFNPTAATAIGILLRQLSRYDMKALGREIQEFISLNSDIVRPIFS